MISLSLRSWSPLCCWTRTCISQPQSGRMLPFQDSGIKLVVKISFFWQARGTYPRISQDSATDHLPWQQSIMNGWSQRSFPVIPWLNSRTIQPILVPVHCSIPIFVLCRESTASTPSLMKSSLKLQCKKIPKSSVVSTSQIIHYQLCCSGWHKELVQQAMTDSFLLKNGTIWQSRVAIPHYPGPAKHFCSLSKAHEQPADVDRLWERIWTTAVAQFAMKTFGN